MLGAILAIGLSAGAAAPLALVELYSSEGCSSCPPADALLAELDAGDPSVVALELHVDYWNNLGWADPFSSAAFSERQSRYATWLGSDQVFTPQAIVNGAQSVVGSHAAELREALKARAALATLEVSFAAGVARVSGRAVPKGELWLAIAETGLETDVARGENRGRHLRHGPVVRRLDHFGVVSGDLARSLPLKLDPSWGRERLRLVAVVQDPADGHVLALGSLRGL